MAKTTSGRPDLEHIGEAIRAVASGNLDTTIDSISDRELLPLVEAFREMTANLRSEFGSVFSQTASMRNLIETLPVAIVKWSNHGELLLANRAALELWKYPDRQEFISKRKIQDLFERPEELKRLIQDTAEVGCVSEFELNIVNSQGETRLVSVTAAPLRDEAQSIIGFVAALREISGQREMEAHLLQMEKLESLSSLAAGLSHDLNNILCGILPNLELLRRRIAQNASMPETADRELQLLDSVEKAAQVGMTLSKQLMSFSRSPEQHVSNLAVVNPNTVIMDSLHHLREALGTGIQIQADLADDIGNIEVDQGQFEEILIHLAKNAQHSMKGTGTLRVSTCNVTFEADASPGPPGLEPGSYVEILISDDGRGISPEYLHRIFDPFFDVDGRGKGMGLALSMVLRMVKNHRGAIEVESNPDTETTFRIYFPSTIKTQAAEAPVPAAPTKHLERILVVDDETLVREATTRLLAELGYEVSGAQDGDEALMRLSQGEEFDLVILDLQMPRLGGTETLSRLRDLQPNLKVILTSGYFPSESLHDLLRRHRCGYLQKPFRLAEISSAIRAVLSETNN